MKRSTSLPDTANFSLLGNILSPHHNYYFVSKHIAIEVIKNGTEVRFCVVMNKVSK